MAGTNQKELLQKLNDVLALSRKGVVKLKNGKIEVIRSGEFILAPMHSGYVRIMGTNETRYHETIIMLSLQNQPPIGSFTEHHLVELWLDGKIQTLKAQWDNDETILLTLYGLYCRGQSLQPSKMKRKKGSAAYKVYHACIKGKRKSYHEYLEDLVKLLIKEGRVSRDYSVEHFYFKGDVRAVGSYVHRVVFSLFEQHLKDEYRSSFIINQHSRVEDLDETIIPDIEINQSEVLDIKLSSYSDTTKEAEVYKKYYDKVCVGFLIGDQTHSIESEVTICSLSSWISSKTHFFNNVDQLLKSVSQLAQEVGEGRYNDLYPLIVDYIFQAHQQEKKLKEISFEVKEKYGFDYSPSFISGVINKKYLRAYLTAEHHAYLDSIEKVQEELLSKKLERNSRIYHLAKEKTMKPNEILELINKEYPEWPLKSISSLQTIIAIQELDVATEHILDDQQQQNLETVIEHTFKLDAQGFSSHYISLCTGKSTASVNGLLAGSRYPHFTEGLLNERHERLEKVLCKAERLKDTIWQLYLSCKSQFGKGHIIETVAEEVNIKFGTNFGKREIEYAIFTHPDYERHQREEGLKRALVTKLVLEAGISQYTTKGKVEDLKGIQEIVQASLNEKITIGTIRHYLNGRGVKRSKEYLTEIQQLLDTLNEMG